MSVDLATAADESAETRFPRCGHVFATSREQCATAPDVLVMAGCVHEHIRGGPICLEHLQHLENGHVLCKACYDCADPHRCKVIVDSIAPLQSEPS